MDCSAFLAKILPSSGVYFVATLHELADGRPYFKHAACESPQHAAYVATQLDQQGQKVYHACASYREPFVTETLPSGETKQRQRVQKNVMSVRSFWLDLDVGPDDPTKYESQAAALGGIVSFVRSANLPLPMLVSSGYGIHCYWPLLESVSSGQWVQAARLLKSLASALGLRSDPSRTSDSASVLRPIGTYNRKNPARPVPVELIRDAEPIEFVEFYRLLEAACKSKEVALPQATPATKSVNEKFLIPSDYPDSHAALVADRCQQVRRMRDTKGNLPEPVWYAAMQVLQHTTEGDAVVHEWSAGHPGYDPSQTNLKLEQLRRFGPTSCATFGERNPDGCVGCPFKNKITSPIQLGVKVESLPAPVVEARPGIPEARVELPNPPEPFIRSKDGVFMEMEEGALQKVHDYDIFPVELSWDEHVDYETATVRHYLPLEGWKEFTLPTFLVESQRDFNIHLRKYHVKPANGKLMVTYMTAYLQTLQKNRHLRKLYTSMGWKEENRSFVLGKKLFQSDGTVHEAGTSSKLNGSLAGFKTRGDLALWSDATKALGMPGMEAHAFSLLLGFGAPLLRLTGYNGVVFSLLGKTNGGKSTMAKWLMSIWGDYELLKVGFGDTPLAKTERIGMYCNLPVYVDEASKMEPKEASKLAYDISQGEGRKRLKADSSERASLHWNTFLITSTNQSLQSKLEAEKTNSKAEAVRLFEYEVPVYEHMVPYWKALHPLLANNYGHAGEAYVHWLVQNSEAVKENLRVLIEHIEQRAQSPGDERFWVAGCACAIYGGMIAKALGLIQFDVAPVIDWVVDTLKRLRSTVADGTSDEVGILGSYLDEYAGTRLVVGGGHPLSGHQQVYKAPHGPLFQRFETDTRMIFISRAHIKFWLAKQGEDYTTVKKALTAIGLLVSADKRKVLGGGTDYASTQIPCWQLRLDHPVLEGVARATDREVQIKELTK